MVNTMYMVKTHKISREINKQIKYAIIIIWYFLEQKGAEYKKFLS